MMIDGTLLRRSIRFFGHAEFPAPEHSLSKLWRSHRGCLDARDERIEMMLEWVFEQTDGDRRPGGDPVRWTGSLSAGSQVREFPPSSCCGKRVLDAAAAHTRLMHSPKDGGKVLVSLKWRQTGGTAEQKVPFEIMCLSDAVRAGDANRDVVLGGDGWTLRDYYTSGALAEHLIHAALVRVVTLEAFIRPANNGEL